MCRPLRACVLALSLNSPNLPPTPSPSPTPSPEPIPAGGVGVRCRRPASRRDPCVTGAWPLRLASMTPGKSKAQDRQEPQQPGCRRIWLPAPGQESNRQASLVEPYVRLPAVDNETPPLPPPGRRSVDRPPARQPDHLTGCHRQRLPSRVVKGWTKRRPDTPSPWLAGYRGSFLGRGRDESRLGNRVSHRWCLQRRL